MGRRTIEDGVVGSTRTGFHHLPLIPPASGQGTPPGREESRSDSAARAIHGHSWYPDWPGDSEPNPERGLISITSGGNRGTMPPTNLCRCLKK